MLVDNKSSDFLKNMLGGKILSDAENYFKKLNNAQRTEVGKLGVGGVEKAIRNRLRKKCLDELNKDSGIQLSDKTLKGASITNS